ncbi:MAG: polysaccharide biosynthesis tyrosine autokinase [Candidatus Omnitrophota bacterium]
MDNATVKQDVKISLRDYLRIVFYWRGCILLLFFAILSTSAALSFLWPPTYEGNVTLLVEAGQESLVEHRSYGAPAVPSSVNVADQKTELAKTQSEIIKSSVLLGQVVDELSLQNDADIKGPFKRQKAIDKLSRRVFVNVIRDTNLIKLSVEDKYADRSARIANAIAGAYMDWSSQARKGRAHGAYSFLREQAAAAEKELGELEDALHKLKRSRGVSALDEQTKMAVEQLGEFDTEYNKTKSKEQEVSAQVSEIREKLNKQKEMVITSTDITTNPVIETLKIKLVDLEIKLTHLRSKYTEDNPLVINAIEEVEQVRGRLNEEVEKIFGTEVTSANPIHRALTETFIELEAELHALQAKKQALERIRDEYSKKLQNLSDAELEYTRLLRRIKGKEALYLTLLEKQGEAGLTEALGETLLVNVSIIDPATTPVKPVRPKKMLNIILGIIVGLATGIAGAFARENLDHSLKTVSHVVRFTGLSVLGVIPRVKKEKRLVPFKMGADVSEAYSSMRATLLKLCKEKSIKTILVTSPDNLDGKSVVASNLAISFSDLKGRKTLLADMNLRNPSIDKLFENANANLTEILMRKMGDMFSGMGEDGLTVITGGETPEDPSKVLTSAEMTYFLKEAKSRFDLIILDSSSATHYAESRLLAHEVDAIILVVRSGKTKREVVERCRAILDVPEDKLIGVVLNCFEYVIPGRLYRHI